MHRISVLITLLSLFGSPAFADIEHNILEVINILSSANSSNAKNTNIEQLASPKRQFMNKVLTNLKATFQIEEQLTYKTRELNGVRYVIKNISNKPLCLLKAFGSGNKLRALMFSKRILKPNETAAVYTVETIK